MNLEAEIARLRQINGQLRVAFNNVSEEREFLRKQVKVIRDLARGLDEACRMYEGQQNARREEDIPPGRKQEMDVIEAGVRS